MKLKSILLTAVATISLATATMAQVPNYVPTNGLVGWWPFNGNANDESGNGHNGNINGATLNTDRFGISNSSYLFNGSSGISILNTTPFSFGNQSFSVGFWFKTATNNAGDFISYDNCINSAGWKIRMNLPNGNQGGIDENDFDNMRNPQSNVVYSSSLNNNAWHHLLFVRDIINMQYKFYIDGNNVFTTQINSIQNINGTNIPLIFGNCNGYGYYTGNLDDIGIWNRALTQQEVTDLYNAFNCANNTTITPQTNSLTAGSTATFTASTSDPNPSYVWQSDLGQGFQTLNDFGNYSGTNTGTLNIANVQLPNHTQPIRVISTSGNCIDTSNVSVINILDTCITNVTVYDTLLTTVTDTLVINTQTTGINPPNNLNTLKVFPNPASTHITIDYGNFNAMSGYTLTIVNSIGQTVFTTPINQQTSYIDLSTWSGNGIYFVQLIDPQNNTIENRKIVIQ